MDRLDIGGPMHRMGRKAGAAVVACALVVGGLSAPAASGHHSKPHKLCAPGQHPAPAPGFKPGSCKRGSASQSNQATRSWSGMFKSVAL